MTTEAAQTMPAIDKIAAALSKAQAKLTNPPKNREAKIRSTKGESSSYKYRYADLADILDHVRAALGENGLAVVQLMMQAEGRNVLVSRLIHESGQFFESTYPLPNTAAAQEMGSAITYARRYSITALLGIAAEDDDDGEKGNDAGKGSNSGDRDRLVNLMGEAALGNKAIMDYCRANQLGDGRTVEDLTPEAVELLVDKWTDVVAAIKAATKPAAKPAATEAKPAPAAEPTTKAEAAPATEDLSGVDPKLAELMKAAKVTKAQLKKYYVDAKHLPATVEPEKLPASYLKALQQPANWKKAVETMTALV